MGLNSAKDRIVAAGERCVRCAYCLPYCPTYTKTLNEAESPRGRIALMLGLARDELSATENLKSHLDLCLNCRTCEAVCPVEVTYGQMIDDARNWMSETKPQLSANLPAWMSFLWRHSRLLQAFAWVTYGVRGLGLFKLLEKLKLLKFFNLQKYYQALPERLSMPLALKPCYPAQSVYQGSVALFSGCINTWMERDVLLAGIRVLNTLGYEVVVPRRQKCCGALHFHNGANKVGLPLAKVNIKVFAQYDYIISTATGCGATLREYPQLIPDFSPEDSEAFSAKIFDIQSFLSTKVWPTELLLKPLQKRVGIHIPCSMRNVLKEPNNTEILLKKIPGIDKVLLGKQLYCCGAAGNYMFEHSAMAQDLVKDLIQDALDQNVDIIVTSNIGCRLHIEAQIKQRKISLEVRHPVELLCEQLVHKKAGVSEARS